MAENGRDELAEAKARWKRDAPRWRFVLDTFWALDDRLLIEKLAILGSLDAAVEQAKRERDGMVAT